MEITLHLDEITNEGAIDKECKKEKLALMKWAKVSNEPK